MEDDDIYLDSNTITLDISNMTGTYAANIPYVSGSSDTITLDGYYDNNTSVSNSIFITDSFSGSVSLDIDSMTDSLSNWAEEQQVLSDYREEKAIRERNPGIQAAWEQYKILVELAKNPPDET